MISNRELYAAQIQMIIHAENVSWNRLYNFLMGNSILVLAWATIYASSQCSVLTRFVLSAICLLGGVSGIAWIELGARSRDILKKHMNQTLAIEDGENIWEGKVEDSLKPIKAAKAIVDDPKWKCYGKSMFLLKAMPCAFTALYVVMGAATWLGR